VALRDPGGSPGHGCAQCAARAPIKVHARCLCAACASIPEVARAPRRRAPTLHVLTRLVWLWERSSRTRKLNVEVVNCRVPPRSSGPFWRGRKTASDLRLCTARSLLVSPALGLDGSVCLVACCSARLAVGIIDCLRDWFGSRALEKRRPVRQRLGRLVCRSLGWVTVGTFSWAATR
jgi:hypothetical protein